jgi:hypothetical protein
VIRVGFYYERGEPTLWLHLESAADFHEFCITLTNLADGVTEFVKTIDHPEAFKRMPGIIGLTLATLPLDVRSGRTKLTFNAGNITWSMGGGRVEIGSRRAYSKPASESS